MDRRKFLLSSSLMLLSLNKLSAMAAAWRTSPLMPVMFVGHGNPMNAIEKNSFSDSWRKIGKELPKPNAILCISAHWETRGTRITAMPQPKTIHDFGGFPQELFDQQYPAPGNPHLAADIQNSMRSHIELDHAWGLDHGTWSVLLPMFPDASIPVLQLSLDRQLSPQQHFDLASELSFLRSKGVLIIGSGNLVHNLPAFFRANHYDWAEEFDQTAFQLMESRNFQPLVNYQNLGEAACMSIPTNEHYLPLLYTLALVGSKDEMVWFNEDVMSAISMRSFVAFA